MRQYSRSRYPAVMLGSSNGAAMHLCAALGIPWLPQNHAWWYGQLGSTAHRLLVECFALVEPWWTLRTRSVPFWLSFTAEGSASALEEYLTSREPFDEIYLMLLSNGIEAIGQAPIARWRELLQRARRRGRCRASTRAAFRATSPPSSGITPI